MVTVTHISGYSDTFISKFQCEIIILGQFLHLKEVFREVILTGILLSPIEWLNLNRHTLIINKRSYLNRYKLIIHRKACLFCTWVVTCGYSDTPLTVTLLPFPEGVTVSGHYCIWLFDTTVVQTLFRYLPSLSVYSAFSLLSYARSRSLWSTQTCQRQVRFLSAPAPVGVSATKKFLFFQHSFQSKRKVLCSSFSV